MVYLIGRSEPDYETRIDNLVIYMGSDKDLLIKKLDERIGENNRYSVLNLLEHEFGIEFGGKKSI